MEDALIADHGGHLTIVEMARLYGISLRTLRFYEQQGLLSPKRNGQQRLYAPRDRIRLELILAGKRLRFSLHEIDNLIRGYISSADAEPPAIGVVLTSARLVEQIAALQEEKSQIEATLAELKAAMQSS